MSAKRQPADADRPADEAPMPPREDRPVAPEASDEADEDTDAQTADDLEAAKAECDRLLERLQRTTADYQNYQKRMQRRVEEARQYAIQEFLVDLLAVVDNFERALEADAPDAEAFREGVQLVHDQLLATFRRHGVTRIEALGEPFDPELHEAVARVPSAEHPEGTVVEVMQNGYLYNGRTIRASRVIVSSGPADDGAA